MRRNAARFAVVAALLAGLAGCGYSTGDRAASGGLIGAGAGAAIGAAAGNPLAGALAGGAVGAIGGAATSGNSVNLGKPIWR
jgi:osmotically inducible lipoprotein OsmB